ncbi:MULTISPECIES: hypothetical protein [Arthrobacter]|uniref:Uncharacterized protein n=1 Tax=Arthrobacter terricola TaxID=2547396 RepID=A0A4R5KAI6_9MICC|nr:MULTISPECIES: hypothetical protein [Arthrobacter]MBT8162795.1 hypothetical protein [Arthrobacter sp. GN70]TDF92046.1 hypothetical protein E1809_18880 [Arthrobacter terricola]
MPTFDSIRQEADERALIRKIQKAVGFIAPADVDLPETLFGVGGALIDLKALGWMPIGIVTKDGYEFGRDVSKEDVEALGYASAVRSDTTAVARSIKMTPLETGRKHMQELVNGTDLSAVTQAANGEIVFDEPDLPADKEYRLLVIGSDGPAAANWILGRGYGRVKLVATDSEKWGSGDPVQQPLTFDVYTDSEIGSPVRKYMGGTAALANKTILGFAQATP